MRGTGGLIDRIERMEHALRPFANAAEPYAEVADPNTVQVSIPLGMLRAAARALDEDVGAGVDAAKA